jgi:IS1 family transposase
MRSISRVVDCSINTVSRELVIAGYACAEFHDAMVRKVKAKKVQCDEIWSFCYAKAMNVPGAQAAPERAGDVWTWTAIDADSKVILSWYVGKRDAGAASRFMTDLSKRLANRVQLTTDGHGAYLSAVDGAFGLDVDFAQLVKLYGPSPDDGSERRYSPAECVGTRKRKVVGAPDPKHVSTSFVERHNLNMRMSMKRFGRLTNAHSKKFANHCHALALYFVVYNFVRIHKTLRMTPAMVAGVADRLFDMEYIAKLTDRYEEKETKRVRHMLAKIENSPPQ